MRSVLVGFPLERAFLSTLLRFVAVKRVALPFPPPSVIGFQPMQRLILVLGILLLLAGAIGLAHPTFTYNKKEDVAKIGPIQATVEHEKIVEIPMALSILLVVTGIGLTVFGLKGKK